MKNKFIKSTVILLIGGIITKLLSFVIRIYFTRAVGQDGINIYSLIMPSYSLFITICQLGFPISISNIVAKGEKRGKNVIFSIIPVAIIVNLFLILIIIFAAKYLCNNLLHNPDCYYPLISLAFVLPFISLSSIIRGYFFGKQQMLPHSISNIVEQLFKLFVVLIIIPFLLKYGTIIAVSGYILISILSETMSIIIFLLYLPKGFNMNIKDIKPDLGTMKDVLAIGLPTTGSRIIGNIAYFLEPIILSFGMIKSGYSTNYIINEYAVYNTYTLGVLMVPTYFLVAISTSLLPEIAKNLFNKEKIKKLLKRIVIFSLLLGVFSNIIIYFFAGDILNIIFNTTAGFNYIKLLCFFFILYYLEAPLSTALQALGESKYLMRTTIISSILKLFIIYFGSLLHIGIYGLIISEIASIIIVVILNYYKLKSKLN